MNPTQQISVTSYLNRLIGTANSGIDRFAQITDFKAAQRETQALVERMQENTDKVTTLSRESADFLKDYTTGMNRLEAAATKLANGGAAALAKGHGDAATKEDAVKATVDAVKGLVKEANQTRALLGDNAERGSGVQRQLQRMADAPTAREAMALVGLTVDDAGALTLNEQWLTEALENGDDNQRRLLGEIVGGVADDLRQNALAGKSVPAQSLVEADVGRMQALASQSPMGDFLQGYHGAAGAFATTHNAAMGLLINMMV